MNEFFCSNCKKKVETITLFVKGDEVHHCAECGATIVANKYDPVQSNVSMLEKVIIAEDSKLLRNIAKDTLLSMKIAREVVTCTNGAELLEKYALSIKEKKLFDLFIIDLNMPILGGLSSSIAIRSIENGLGISKKPIMFFTITEMTEEIRKFFQLVKPAVYLHKGDASDPGKLSGKLTKGIIKLLTQLKEKKGR